MHVAVLISDVNQQNRALRDREAHGKGVQIGFVISMLFSEI
jgi:hypothetical protein